jgi:protein-S-isoprenylcysteine O-methyltransferase Ste14
VTGPYQWVRHPMYLSVMLFMLGMVIYNNHWINTLSLITLSLAILGKMHKEEQYLQTRFSNYADYMRSHKRLIPFIY